MAVKKIKLLPIWCLLVIAVLTTVDSEEELCKKVEIDAATRQQVFDPKTKDFRVSYRVYRDQYFWELIGLPKDRVKVKGPFDVPKDMLPINSSVSIVSIGAGPLKGKIYKFATYSRRWWRFDVDGKFEDSRNDWDLNTPRGFDAAYNDGDLDDKGHARTIAFFGSQVNYFMTRGIVWEKVQPWHINGTKYGQFNESFPLDHDLTAAMPYEPPKNDPHKYYVYLFRWDTYCFRPYKGVVGCPGGWKKNRDLFNCDNQQLVGPSYSEETTTVAKLPSENKGVTSGSDRSEPEETTNAFNLIAIIISFVFYYLL